MSLPTAVFLDTSILAGQQYNFTSAALSSFIPVAKEKKLQLLLPDPTKREIMRQITERSINALRALEEARRKAPFLAKWEHFSKLPDSRHGDWEVKRVAIREWNAFLKQFNVLELGYDAVKLETVMGWYETVRAPFGLKKRKEFPDAFAIAALASYGERTSTFVAVVSEDRDFKAACDHYPYLLYFPSLPAVTELFISADKAIEETRELILAYEESLNIAIAEEAEQSLTFYHADSKYKDIDTVEIEEVESEDIRIVGLGDRDCTVTFECYIHFSVKLRWEDCDRYSGEPEEVSGRVNDYALVSGIAKLHIKDDRSGIEGITLVELDQGEIEITKEPR